MESRILSALELRRLTGASDLEEQIENLKREEIPHRVRPGWLVGVNVYTNELRPLISRMAWAIIEDENIGTWE